MPTEVPVSLKLKAVDKITGVLKKATGGLNRVKKATQRASNAFRSFQEKTKGMRNAIGKVGTGFKNVGQNLSTKVTLPIVGLGVGIIKTAATFEKSMNKVKALSQATGEDFKNLRNLAMKLGSSTKFSASESADAMAFLAQAGFKTNEILKATPALLDLAAASSTDLARTADIASNVMGAFNIKASETKRVADVFARATAGSNVDMEMLAETMKEAAPLAKNFGASLEETTAAAGLLGNIGIQGSKAGTALKNAFLNLSAPSSQAKKALSALGIEVADENGKMFKFGKIMQNLGTRLADLPQKGRLQALNLIFGKIGVAAATNLAKVASTGELERFTKQMFNTEITAKSMAQTMSQGASGAMTEMKSAMEGLAIAIAGEGENSPLGAFTAIVKKISGFIQEISKTNPEIFKMAIVAAGLVAALGPVLMIFGSLLGIIPTLITLAGALGVSFGVFTASLIGIPLLIAAIVAGGYYLIKNWDKVKEFFITVFDSMKEKVKGFLKFLPSFIQTKLGLTTEVKDNLKAGTKETKSPSELKAEKIAATARLTKLSDIFAKMKPPEGLGQGLGFSTEQIQQNVINLGKEKEIRRAEATQKNESKVMVDFKNLPKGTTIKTESTDDSLFSVDTGLQASSL